MSKKILTLEIHNCSECPYSDISKQYFGFCNHPDMRHLPWNNRRITEPGQTACATERIWDYCPIVNIDEQKYNLAWDFLKWAFSLPGYRPRMWIEELALKIVGKTREEVVAMVTPKLFGSEKRNGIVQKISLAKKESDERNKQITQHIRDTGES